MGTTYAYHVSVALLMKSWVTCSQEMLAAFNR